MLMETALPVSRILVPAAQVEEARAEAAAEVRQSPIGLTADARVTTFV
jgi:hypothetical protein